MGEFELKVAAAAVRKLPELQRENQELREKLATLERTQRVESIHKAAAAKQVQIPDDEDLTKASEDRLRTIEVALDLLTPSGAMKLGEVDSSAPASRPGMDPITEFLLNPADHSGEGE